jgi:hypothetical protein
MFRKLNAYERQNYDRLVPSTNVLTQGEKNYYTGIFASRGYDTENAYNFYRERVKASRTGYLRGLGEEPSLWDRLSAWWGSGGSSDPECPAGLSPEGCEAYILAHSLPDGTRVTVTTDERSSSSTHEGPAPAPEPPRNKLNTYLWIGAGIVGVAILMRAMK